MRSTLFDYDLPKSAIAQKPCRPRDRSRLWHVNGECSIKSSRFYNLGRFLRDGDVLVVNDCKTVGGRIAAESNNKSLSLTFCGLAAEPFCFYVFAKPAKNLGTSVELGGGVGRAEVVRRGERFFTLKSRLPHKQLLEKLATNGAMPLPLYIKRQQPVAADFTDYQTHFAKRLGGAATPTAALHFTPRLVAALRRRRVKIAVVTLMVGGATFIPIRSEHLGDHKMPMEHGRIGTTAAATINSAIRDGRRVVAVGTTSLRLLEAAAGEGRGKFGSVAAKCLATSIFISPGYRFKVADMLLTNFHPPMSSALVLAAAICGTDEIKRSYRLAIAHGLRFFSYGDCCLLHINKRKRANIKTKV